jgi:(E)-4-hydroxy-3-methylbut-2-enyl-diphosphate synthase
VSALKSAELAEKCGLRADQIILSAKVSGVQDLIDVYRSLAARCTYPLHLGLTEAGMGAKGIVASSAALGVLLQEGIGDTIRVSLTVPNDRKQEEIAAGKQILSDIAAGRVRSVVDFGLKSLNIISCPSCSRVENEAFVDLAAQVKELTAYAKDYAITIAVMGCRVNGPGETDDADLGLWCAPNFVNLKKGEKELGAYPYDEILPRLKAELDALIAQRAQPART